MTWKEFVYDCLNFSRRDRIAIIVITAFIVLIFFLPKFIPEKNSSKQIVADTTWITAMKKLEQKDTDNGRNDYKQYTDDNSNNYQYDRSQGGYTNRTKDELFYFDPNTLTAEGWEKLGLRDRTIHTIQNYLSKGGHFKKPEDLKKIYGLFPNEYERIAPFIRIVPASEPGGNFFIDNPVSESPLPNVHSSRYTTVEINSGDTAAFIALPGIGSKLAARIVNFRDKLGGFYSISQVGETFGLPDSTFQKIKQYLKLENTPVRKININTATLDELKVHPYIKWSIANPIIAYRNEHGLFGKIEDIKKVAAVTEEIYNKIAPYLTTQ